MAHRGRPHGQIAADLKRSVRNSLCYFQTMRVQRGQPRSEGLPPESDTVNQEDKILRIPSKRVIPTAPSRSVETLQQGFWPRAPRVHEGQVEAPP